MTLTAINRVRELQDGFRANVDSLLSRRAPEAIADTQRHFENDEHLSPEQLADYRHRLAQYARSGSKPTQPDLDLPPCA